MILVGSITIPSSHWGWLIVPVLIATTILLLWSYRRSAELGAVHKVALCLRLLGIILLLLCLIEPLWFGRRVKSGANLFVVIADNSSGMNVRDRSIKQSRGEILKNALKNDKADWLSTLTDNFQVRKYIFDSRLRRTIDFSDLAFDGKASMIGTTLRTIAERYQGRPLAGIILMTDGNATDMAEKFYDLSDMPPIYPVLIGDSQQLKDISLTNVSVSQTSFEDAPVTIQADIEAIGYTGRTIAVNLTKSSGEIVEHQTQKIYSKNAKQVFRFRLRPDQTGILFYHLNVTEEIPQDRVPEQPEATLLNNERTVVIDRGKGPYRILYVTGRPNWEYKFLQRAITEDEQMQMVGLLRVAKREPKYDWRGRTGDQSNPLYRGFDNTDENQTEQYDQPVFVRLNTRDETELRDGFPKTAEELFGYHAIVLDDLESDFFSHDQMELLQRFVTERGGGFLMLGGTESFQKDFHRTPIGRILPVYLDQPNEQKTVAQHLNLTREGWLQPWVRIYDNEQDEQQRLLEMPTFRVLNYVTSTKPGAQVLATIGNNQARQFPALVAQRYGNGRSAALTIGDIWRWGMKQPKLRNNMNKFWRQTLRWLVADVPSRISIQATHKSEKVNQPVVLQIRARRKDFEPMDNISVAIEIREPKGKKVQLTAEPVLTENGLFEATYIPRLSGSYFAQATVTGVDGTEVGNTKTGWATDLEAHEFQSIRTNRPLLERIAHQTGGQVIELNALNNFVGKLPHRDAPITETWIKPLWDLKGILPITFLLILICFAGEWTLRRWKGMP